MSEKTLPPADKKRSFRENLGRIALRVTIYLLAAAASTLIILYEKKSSMRGLEFVVDEPAPRTVFSTLEINYENNKATQELREASQVMVPPVYRVNIPKQELAFHDLNEFFKLFDEAISLREAGQKAEIKDLGFDIARPTLRLLLEKNSLGLIRHRSQSVLKSYFDQGVFDHSIKENLLDSKNRRISWIDGDGKEQQKTAAELLTPEDFKDYAENLIEEEFKKNRNLKNAILEIAENFATSNAAYDAVETGERQKKAAEAVQPVMATIKKNQLIAQQGLIVTEEAKERIDQLEKEMEKHQAENKFIAVSALVGLGYLLINLFLSLFERRVLASLRSNVLIVSALLINIMMVKLVGLWPGEVPIYWMPTAMAPLLLVLLMQPSIALLAGFVMTLFTAVLTQQSIEMMVATQVAGFAAVFSGLKIRCRAQFIRVGFCIGLAYFTVFLIFNLYNEVSLLDAIRISSIGFGNGMLLTLLTAFLLVPAFEGIFKMMTDVTLLELSDLNHPLLKRMVVEAPGTYHHSLVVSTLAESACEGIGANALLARVGCYFHDIGKIARAEYFTENQGAKYGGRNEHEKLTPRMSSIMIMNHVKDGIELGKKYKLKEPILKFIPEHQGTGVVYYFYRKALDDAKPGEKVHPDDYRYPGPKPQSRETAVALLADSTEAASRSLKNPTAESIRQLVRKIINDKFIDGQLDECDLTLRDLHKIQERFVDNLMAIFHTRVAYPTPPDHSDKPDLFKANEFSKFRVDTASH